MPRNVIIGTAGHIDHGKSALVKALTGTDPDRLKEEKERGITIELGFAHLHLPSGIRAGIVDVPGHEKFVRTMVAGAAGIDIVMLVIAADEGIMPQTREHLDICRLLAVRYGLVVMTKCDRTDADWTDLQEEEIRAFVRGSFLDGQPVVRVSAVTGDGLPALVAALDALAADVPGKDPGSFFRLPIDRSFTMKGFGTVVTGTLIGGTVRVGDEVRVLPDGPAARVRGLQVHGGPVEFSSAGTRTAVNLQGLEKDEAPRGAVLCHPGTVPATRMVEAHVDHLLLAPRPLRSRALVSFHAGTAASLGRVVLYGTPGIPPGGSGFARIELSEEMVLMGGDRFILRGFSPLANFGYTVGGGSVLHPCPPRRKGAGKTVPDALRKLREGNSESRVLAALEDSGAAGLSERTAAVVAGTGPAAAQAAIGRHAAKGLVLTQAGGSLHWHAAVVSAVGRRCLEALSALHDRFPDREGFPREEVAAALPGAPEPALVALALADAEPAQKTGDLYFLPAKRPRAVEISSPLARAIAERVRKARLAGPTRTELRESLRPRDGKEFEKTLEGLSRAGALLRIKDLYFDPEEIAGLKDRLVAFLERRGEITVPEFKDLAGLTRKHIIPLLEHFDVMKVTYRVGDKRVLRKGR
jgi:selenocysteine-specific elongation factor